MSNKFCLAVIPARGGSKRVPRKNVRDLCGKPIIAYTVEAALNSSVFKRVVVSTDDDEIASVALRHGAEVPFVRSLALADDYTPVSLVTLDALQRLDPDNSLFEHVAQLMPNCPLRGSEDIVASHRQFAETDSEAQISVTRYGWLNPWWAMTCSESFRLRGLFPEQKNQRSQDLPEVFCPTGAIWWAKSDVLRSEKTFYTRNCTGWEIQWQHAVDIDTNDDWQLAELLMQGRRQKIAGA